MSAYSLLIFPVYFTTNLKKSTERFAT